jgi:hypothetical protein
LLSEDEEDVAVTAQSCKCFSPCSNSNSEKRLLATVRLGEAPNEGNLLGNTARFDDDEAAGDSPLPTDNMAMPEVNDAEAVSWELVLLLMLRRTRRREAVGRGG